MRNLVIIGAGGLAREIYDLAVSCYANDPEFKIKGFLSDSPSDIATKGYPGVLNTVAGYEVEDGDMFFCAIGSMKDRKKTVEIILGKNGTFINLIHPSATISPSVKLGQGIAIRSYCVLASNVTIEDFTYLQSSVIMGHDVHVGRYCQVNAFSFLAGYVRVHDLVLISAGVKIIQNIVIETNAIVGMGSVVLRKVKEGTTVFGVPAKKVVY